MHNLVGSVVPAEKEIAALAKEIAALDAKISKFVDVHLTPEERRGLPKFRPGAEPIAALIGRLATERGITIPGESVEAMQADLTLAERLRPLLSAAEQLHKRVDDGHLEAQGECWSALVGFYSVLSSMAARDPALATALKPATEFFATGRRKKPATKTP